MVRRHDASKCSMVQPESVATKPLGTPGPKVSSNASSLLKMWTPSAFRLNIDGVNDMQYVNKIDSFTVTLDTKKFYTGASRFPEIVPLKLKLPNIKGTIAS